MSWRVLGVDPGTAATGYGVVELADSGPGLWPGGPGRLVECGVVRSEAGRPMAERLQALYQGMSEVIARWQPAAMAIETVFTGSNARSALLLGQARGVILLAAARAGLAIAEFAPATVKQTVTGAGRAGKARVAYMVQQLLRLQRPPSPADAADAVAVALTYLLSGGAAGRLGPRPPAAGLAARGRP